MKVFFFVRKTSHKNPRDFNKKNVVNFFIEPIDYSGALAVVVGRGKTGEDEAISDELRKVNVHILPEEECKQTGYEEGKVTSNMFCAGYLDGQYDSCHVSIQ